MTWAALGLLAACTTEAPAPPVPPSAAVLDVIVALDEAVDRSAQGDPQAVEAWVRAHHRFEADLEPLLRARHPPEVVAAAEYRFSRIRVALDGTVDADAVAEVDALEAELQSLLEGEE